MTLEYEFSGIRLQQGFLTPVNWKLTVDLIAPEKKGRSRAESEHIASITYQKLYFWLDTNLPSVVAVDVTNEDDFYVANIISNITMYCPANPGDDTIIQLLHSKLTVLANNELLVGEVRLKGDDTSVQYTFNCHPDNYGLPETTAEYCKDGKIRDVLPWWARGDGFCFEFIKPTNAEQTDDEYFAEIIDPMGEFERLITDVNDTHVGIVKEPAKIVQVEKWKPRRVD